MHSGGKYFSAFLITTSLLFTHGKALSQNGVTKFNRDSSKTITLLEFNHRVDKAAQLLKTKELSAIPDSIHVDIMMCLNTIFMIHKKNSVERVFTGSRYNELEILAERIKYGPRLAKTYADVIPNRGMGFYFPQLKMELYGTPYRYAIFNVVE